MDDFKAKFMSLAAAQKSIQQSKPTNPISTRTEMKSESGVKKEIKEAPKTYWRISPPNNNQKKSNPTPGTRTQQMMMSERGVKKGKEAPKTYWGISPPNLGQKKPVANERPHDLDTSLSEKKHM